MLQNKPSLGTGIYTPPEISIILKIPQNRIRWYISEVWDNKFGKEVFNERYSWDLRHHKAINFLVLVEFKIVLRLKKLGLTTHKILQARNAIAQEQGLPYPFASSKILANSKHIWYKVGHDVIDADGSRQINFQDFVEKYYSSIEFKNDLAARLFPRGKRSSIVVDPHHQLGQPIIKDTNITADTIYSMYKSGDSVLTLSNLYDVPEKKIKDAINFYKNAA